MKSFAITTMLLMSLAASSCAPDEYAPLAAPPAAYPEDDSNTGEPEEPDNPPSTSSAMKITIRNSVFQVTLADNETALSFSRMLPLTLTMSDFNDNEKVSTLSGSLPVAASNPGTIRTGDIMLYGASSLVLFYETFSTSYRYTRIGWVDDPAGLKDALGAGSVDVKFEL